MWWTEDTFTLYFKKNAQTNLSNQLGELQAKQYTWLGFF